MQINIDRSKGILILILGLPALFLYSEAVPAIRCKLRKATLYASIRQPLSRINHSYKIFIGTKFENIYLNHNFNVWFTH